MTRRINLGAISLSITELGEGDPILFLHGFPEDGNAWARVAEPLSKRFRCVMPDLRGYGLSDQPDAVDDYSVDHLIDDIDALANALGMVTFTLAGHDWGGLLAWWYAARRASRVSHLIIANAPHPALFQKALIDDPAQRLASQYVTRLRASGSEAHVPGATTAMINWYLAAPFVVPMIDDVVAMPRWVTAEDFSITVPTLVLWGMRDTALLPVLLEGMESYLPTLTVQRFNDASHNIIHEIPSELAAAIEVFLA